MLSQIIENPAVGMFLAWLVYFFLVVIGCLPKVIDLMKRRINGG